MPCLPVPGVALRPASAQKPVAAVHKSELHLMLQRFSAVSKLVGVTPASRLEARPAPTKVSSGNSEIDDLTGGLPQGCLTEVCGPPSSGRTSLLIAALAAATRRQGVCALVDTTNAFDPLSASAAGVNFERLLWVRCGITHDTEQNEACHAERGRSFAKRSPGRVEASLWRSRSTTEIGISRSARNDNSQNEVEQALRVTDLLLQSGGFGLVAIDLGDVPFPMARRIPLTSWFRFQRAVENTHTVLLVVAQAPCAQTCATLLVRLEKKLSAFSSQPLKSRAEPAHAQLFKGMQIEGELLRSRVERKPAASVDAAFTTKAAWAG
jgi:hypothetical protein